MKRQIVSLLTAICTTTNVSASAAMPPEILNSAEKGSGPIEPPSLSLSGEEQYNEDSMAFSNFSTCPPPVSFTTASEMSVAKREPFGKT